MYNFASFVDRVHEFGVERVDGLDNESDGERQSDHHRPFEASHFWAVLYGECEDGDERRRREKISLKLVVWKTQETLEFFKKQATLKTLNLWQGCEQYLPVFVSLTLRAY